MALTKTRIISFIACLLFIVGLCPAALADSGGGFTDIAGHWAQTGITTAENDGWVSGYPDDTFKPDNPITRAEFVKMLLAAIRLTPESGVSASLISAYRTFHDALPALNFQGSWLETQGWTDTALVLGLVIPSDYPGGDFEPDKAISRYEIAVMADRALGLVRAASAADAGALSYGDAAQIPAWVKGYVKAAKDAGTMTGFPDGTFGGGRPATRAEAVTVALRVKKSMDTGVDSGIEVFVRDNVSGATQQAALTVPAQMLDGRIYVSAVDLYNAASKLYGGASNLRYSWNPAQQSLWFEYGVSHKFYTGDVRYEFYTSGLGPSSPTLPAAPRLLYGVLMIPVYNPGQPDMGNLWSGQEWDGAAKRLTVNIKAGTHPIS